MTARRASSPSKRFCKSLCVTLFCSALLNSLAFSRAAGACRPDGQNPQAQQVSDERKSVAEWLKFSPESAPFSVSLPSSPSEKAKDDDTGMKVHTYRVKAAANEYQVVWFANVPYMVLQRAPLNVLFPRGLEEILKSARQAGKKELLTTHEEDITLKGFHGRESTIESSNDKIEAKGFIAGHDFITVAVLHPKEDSPSADARKFLDSLSLLNSRMPTPRSDIDVSSKPDTRPFPLNRPRPNYTRAAINNRVQGLIRVRALVGADGLVKDVRLVTHLPDGLDSEAMEAVRHMRFKPATNGGRPVATWITMEVEFKLGN
jgi:TonB family protein